MAFNWTCPFCARPQTVTDQNVRTVMSRFWTVTPSIGDIGVTATSIICSNPDCTKATITAKILPVSERGGESLDPTKPLFSWRLVPESVAKPQPDFIPLALREDYYEACKIRDLSPKASATLARRCIQGMIRDFCNIQKGTLYEEISALRDQVAADKAPPGVSLESVEAIDHVRGVGNIGAHMEKDINHIVPVDPEEAQLLIELIESLFDEWYVAREKRSARFTGIKALADSKKKLITELKLKSIEGPKD